MCGVWLRAFCACAINYCWPFSTSTWVISSVFCPFSAACRLISLAMSDKQPLMGGPSAPPPPYQAGKTTLCKKPWANLTRSLCYSSLSLSAPPPQPGYGYGGQHGNTVIVTQARPVESRVFVEIKPPNYVVLSIITLLFFCWIFGLIGLIVGLQVHQILHNLHVLYTVVVVVVVHFMAILPLSIPKGHTHLTESQPTEFNYFCGGRFSVNHCPK